MKPSLRPLVAAGVPLLVASAIAAQSNDTPFNNGADAIFIYSSPSSGFSALAFPPDVNGDLYWRAQGGSAAHLSLMNNVAPIIGSAMEIDGYYEGLFDTDWSTTPSFYVRNHGPALPDSGGLGGLEPSFFQVGLSGGIHPDNIVVIGPSGFGNPCTIAPSLCSPSGGTCPPPGTVNGYLVDLQFGTTVGSGIVVPANGVDSDYALTYFVTGGMTASGGTCGLGDYDLQDLHSTDETQADFTGAGVNPDGGFQLAGSGPVLESVASMTASNETWRNPIVQLVADSGTGMGVEVSDNGGGAANGRRLSTSSGLTTLGVEVRASQNVGDLAVVGISLTPLPNPGLSVYGGNLLVLPDGLFNSTLSVLQGTVLSQTFDFTSEGAMESIQLLVPPIPGVVIYVQGGILVLCCPFEIHNTQVVKVGLGI